MGYRLLRSVLLIVFIGAASAPAQSPDLTQLKDKLQQLEQMMLDLKSQIAAAEQQQAPPGQPLVAAKPTQDAVPAPLVPVEHMGETTRLREVAQKHPCTIVTPENYAPILPPLFAPHW